MAEEIKDVRVHFRNPNKSTKFEQLNITEMEDQKKDTRTGTRDNQPVYYRHGTARCCDDNEWNRYDVQFTVAAVPTESGTFKIGIAICSINDNFSKKVGRELSAKRAAENPFADVKMHGDNQYEQSMNVLAVFETMCKCHIGSLKRMLNEMRLNNK
jgi:hypothetical protein